jgi:dTDP-4-amino-4,6-dideoxygalactose transaminase
VIRHARIEQIEAGLAAAGHGHKAYYRTPIHRQPSMVDYAAGVSLPATDELARTHLAIPVSPVLSAEQADEVTGAIRGAA